LTALAAAVLLAGAALAQQKERTAEPRYEPAEVVAAVEAPYPPNSVAAGTVIFEVTLGSSGAIEEIRKLRDVPSLSEAAERSLKQWKFRAATLDGKPVRSKLTVAFSFTRPIVTPTRP
jgi:protein TonB